MGLKEHFIKQNTNSDFSKTPQYRNMNHEKIFYMKTRVLTIPNGEILEASQ